jgi:HD-like signal output (HDOD) protein
MASMWQRLFGSPKKVPARRVRSPAAKPVRRPAAEPATTIAPVVPLADISDRFHRFVFGLPASDTDSLSAAEAATLKRLDLLSTRFDMRSLPRLPTVLPQLLRTLRNDNAAGAQLAKLVGRDPLMVGEVMRVTGSVYYRSAQPIANLQQAVVLLGQDGLRRVLTQHVMKPILQTNAGTLGHAAGERLWDHAERCAHACAWLGRKNGGDAFEAYLAGIICHTGTGAVVRLLEQMVPAEAIPLFSHDFITSCAQLATRLSLQAAQYWELPARVTNALAERQDPQAIVTSSPLGKALGIADLLAMAYLLGEHSLLPPQLDLSQSWPGIYAPASLARCQQDLRQQFSTHEKRRA